MKSEIQAGGRERADLAAILTGFLEPSTWIPAAYSRWTPLVEGLLEEFLRRFDRETLDRLLTAQRQLPESTPPAIRAAKLATELTALHKVCQILARHPAIPAQAREAIAPLESLPASEIPESALLTAKRLVSDVLPELSRDTNAHGVGRGSVADVFQFRSQEADACPVALKTVRPEALKRVPFEASVLSSMADEAETLVAIAGSEFSRTLAEALRDAARALLREIDFPREALNLEEAKEFYKNNSRVCIPSLEAPPMEFGVFMEFTEGEPVMEASLDERSRRDVATLLFRSLLLEPLFSGLQQSIFHADPHAGNILVRPHRCGGNEIVLLDWSQAGHLSRERSLALIDLCFSCALRLDPSIATLERLLEDGSLRIKIPVNASAVDPLHAAFAVVEELAEKGHPVPLELLLLRKSFLTIEAVAGSLAPHFNAWREARRYLAWVFASEAPLRGLSAMFRGLDRHAYYRTGITTDRALHRIFAKTKKCCAIAQVTVDPVP
jgi:ubiquinone biosynthesis protein